MSSSSLLFARPKSASEKPSAIPSQLEKLVQHMAWVPGWMSFLASSMIGFSVSFKRLFNSNQPTNREKPG